MPLNSSQDGAQNIPLENKDNNNDSRGTRRPLDRYEDSEENHLSFPSIKRFQAISAANESAWELHRNTIGYQFNDYILEKKYVESVLTDHPVPNNM